MFKEGDLVRLKQWGEKSPDMEFSHYTGRSKEYAWCKCEGKYVWFYQDMLMPGKKEEVTSEIQAG
jgi:hypothetical protein